MLRVYDVMIEALKELRPVVECVEKKDVDLARQMRRAASSVALNIAEGSGSSAGTRTQRYRTALGSARETLACIDVARALHGIAIDPQVESNVRLVSNTLRRVLM